jgi:glycine betaine/proline transport system substrate-binding protein
MIKKLLASTLVLAGLGFAGSSSAHECGDITIAAMNWQSAEVLGEIDKLILEKGFGCDVEMVAGDTMPTFTSMNEKGKPDVATELWTNSLEEPLRGAIAEGRLFRTVDVFKDGGEEGIWIPKYLADANPDIKTVEDALKRPELFPHPEKKDKGGIVGCPAGWNCQLIMQNLFKAYDMEGKGFALVDPGSSAGLDGAISKAYERKQGFMGYYWAPTSLLGKYEMVKLKGNAPHDKEHWEKCTGVADCEDPKINDWAPSRVSTVVTKNFMDTSAVALSYFNRRSISNNDLGKLLSWMTENQATGDEAAEEFVKTREDLWSKWVSKETAEKIKK